MRKKKTLQGGMSSWSQRERRLESKGEKDEIDGWKCRRRLYETPIRGGIWMEEEEGGEGDQAKRRQERRGDSKKWLGGQSSSEGRARERESGRGAASTGMQQQQQQQQQREEFRHARCSPVTGMQNPHLSALLLHALTHRVFCSQLPQSDLDGTVCRDGGKLRIESSQSWLGRFCSVSRPKG